ncbi:MAG: hypothetical protein ABR543_12585 [Gemmatimonadaceae bacterium]
MTPESKYQRSEIIVLGRQDKRNAKDPVSGAPISVGARPIPLFRLRGALLAGRRILARPRQDS